MVGKPTEAPFFFWLFGILMTTPAEVIAFIDQRTFTQRLLSRKGEFERDVERQNYENVTDEVIAEYIKNQGVEPKDDEFKVSE